MRIAVTRLTPDGTALDTVGLPLNGQDTLALQTGPAVTSNGTDWLVTWLSDGLDVCALRIAANGTQLDSTVLSLAPGQPFEYAVAAAADNNNYLVVWAGDSPSGRGSDLLGIRLAPDGTLLDPEPFVIASHQAELSSPAVAYADGLYLVVWTDWQVDGDICASRVLPSGIVLDPDGFTVCADIGVQRHPAVAAGHGRFVVVWSGVGADSSYDIYAAVLDSLNPTALNREPQEPRTLLASLVSPLRVGRPITLSAILPCSIQLHLLDSNGRVVRSAASSNNLIDTEGLPPGVYFLILAGGKKTAATRVLLIK